MQAADARAAVRAAEIATQVAIEAGANARAVLSGLDAPPQSRSMPQAHPAPSPLLLNADPKISARLRFPRLQRPGP